MQILVNDSPLDFLLEDERSLADVIDGLSRWLGAGRYEITAIDVDTRSVPIHDRTLWEELSVEDVGTLRVEAKSFDEVQAATISALDEYLGLLREALEAGHGEALAQLAEELPFVRSRLGSIFPAIGGDQDAWALSDSELGRGIVPHSTRVEEILAEISRFRALLAGRAREYDDPDHQTLISLGQLSSLAPRLAEVPVLLQTGHHAEAMSLVVELTELLSRVVRMLPRVAADSVDVEGLKSFTREVAPFLSEVQLAFEQDDTVMIGDLLEYEIAPRLRDLGRLAEREMP